MPNDTETVRSAMRASPLEIRAGTSMKAACEEMRLRRVEEVLVVGSGATAGRFGEVLGIVTESDALTALARFDDPGNVRIEQLMSSPVSAVHPEQGLDEALTTMARLRIHRLPVVDEDGWLVGLLTRDGIIEAQHRSLVDMRALAEKLADEARHDPLTGLANRRSFDETLEREVARQKRAERGLGLLIIDIDHFKLVNDRYGHPRGDLVLVELARRLETNVRRADLVARIGGEEFAVLVTTPDEASLLVLAEKLRRAVASEPFRAPGDGDLEAPASSRPDASPEPLLPQVDLDLTISVGAALFESAMSTPARLVRTADSALYTAKSLGRNRVQLGAFRGSSPALAALRSPQTET